MLALATPEGTRQLGLGQGLSADTEVQVYAYAGELLRICTSDDGIQEAGVLYDGQRLAVDAEPGTPNPVDPRRRGAEIVLYAPNPAACGGDADCAAPATCRDRADGGAAPGVGVCGIPLPVSAERGACNGADPARSWHEVDLHATGQWTLDLAGEPETLRPDGASTRFFEVDVLADGVSAVRSRVSARRWGLDAHQAESVTNADLRVVVPGGQGARVYRLELRELAGGGAYSLLANRHGISGLARRSACLFGEPSNHRCSLEGEPHEAEPRFDIYLGSPEPAPARPPRLRVFDVVVEDEWGTPTITPDGDGLQDVAVLSFTTTVEGAFELLVDTDGSGTFDRTRDRVLRGDARVGRNEIAWDGRDPGGEVVPDGAYAFRLEVAAAEVHLVFEDAARNEVGFRVYEGPNDDPIRLHWDDNGLRDAIDVGDSVRTPDEGAALEARRRWVQPSPGGTDVPLLLDTWGAAETLRITEAGCGQCDGAVATVTVGGEDEVFDRDMDGLADHDEDLDADGALDPGETDPDNPDTDGDGLGDGAVRARGTDPRAPDSDGDGLADGAEVEAGTNPLSRDTDLDGLGDGLEAIGATDPLRADSDGDGLSDGAEDADRDGRVDPGETDPTNPDTDGDGIPDGVEVRGATSPVRADTDGDGLDDGEEDADHDGVVDPGETDPLRRDSDEDGLPDGAEVAIGSDPLVQDTDEDGLFDGVEDADRDGVVDANETDPTLADSDGDGLADGEEDRDHDGRVDLGESDPREPDSDGDGIEDGVEVATGTHPADEDTDGDGVLDGVEDEDHDGVLDPGETDPRERDSDGDGLDDGVERAGGTDPLDEDTDGDGLTDGEEDLNHDGRVDRAETDPRLPDTDGGGESDAAERAAGRDPRDPADDFGVQPQPGDRDGDGLDDEEEARLGTDPDAADTDRDGVPDGVEVATGTHPADEDTDGDGVRDGVEDLDADGVVDEGETDPRDPDDPPPAGDAGVGEDAGPVEDMGLPDDAEIVDAGAGDAAAGDAGLDAGSRDATPPREDADGGRAPRVFSGTTVADCSSTGSAAGQGWWLLLFVAIRRRRARLA